MAEVSPIILLDGIKREREVRLAEASLSDYSNRRWEKVSKEERSRQNKANWDGKSVEEKRLIALKSWETRRMNKEAIND